MFHDASCRTAADCGDLSLQITYTGFTRVVTDNGGQRLLGYTELAFLQPMFGELSWDKVLHRDVNLVLLGVARQLDDFHAIAQCGRDWFQQICCCDEHDA